MTLLTDSNTRW